MLALVLFASLSTAQHYAFPTSSADYPEYYPTAYWDHGSTTDWSCSWLTYSGHRGSDFGAGSWTGMDEGRDITAAAPGVVYATHDGAFDRCDTGDCDGGGGFGNYVYLQHADGRQTIYAHLATGSVQVAVGDEVACGDVLGLMGSSGHSTGPHLHFQVNDTDGASIDPFSGPCSPGSSLWVDQGVWDELPSLDCDPDWAGCNPVQTLSCGDVLHSRNDATGATSEHQFHGCSDFLYSGPELAVEVITDLNEPITVRLSGLDADLDLFAMTTLDCVGHGCLAASTQPDTSDEEVVFDADANTPYGVVIDGWEGAISDFSLEISCDGAGPASPGTTGGTEPPSDTGLPSGSNPRAIPPEPRLGCGCHTSPGPSTGWPVLLLWLMRRRS